MREKSQGTNHKKQITRKKAKRKQKRRQKNTKSYQVLTFKFCIFFNLFGSCYLVLGSLCLAGT
jgi:hypothetical protein